MAVAATNCREVNFQVGQEAKKAGIFVSVADRKEGKHLHFSPPICTGSGLVAGVVSQGEEHEKNRRRSPENPHCIGGVGMKQIRIGSRESRLAVIQSEMVIEAIHNCDSDMKTELVTMKTTGDKIWTGRWIKSAEKGCL